MRQPPYSVDAEKSVIGSLLLDNQTIKLIEDILTQNDFYLESHKRIYKAIIDNYKTSALDFITLANFFTKEELKNIGGKVYISELVDNIPSTIHIEHYAKIVKDYSLRRQILSLAYEISEKVYDELKPIEEIIEETQKESLKINPVSGNSTIKTAKEVARETIAIIEERYNKKSSLVGLSTGLKDLDDITAGLHPGELTIIAGRPGMGKSALAVNIAHAAGMRGEPALIFSIEMPNQTLMMRIMASMAKIESRLIRKGFISESEWPKIVNSISQIAEAPIYFDDSPLLKAAELRARARKAKKEHNIKLIVVDYLQIMTPAAGKSDRREREIAEISAAIKSIARELNIPVIAVSQLNRGVDSRPDKRPLMSDLRESGAIEQDADLILFIYRDEVYNKSEDNENKGIAEIGIGKNRHGSTSIVKCVFADKYQQFLDFDYRENTAISHKTRGNYGYPE